MHTDGVPDAESCAQCVDNVQKLPPVDGRTGFRMEWIRMAARGLDTGEQHHAEPTKRQKIHDMKCIGNRNLIRN